MSEEKHDGAAAMNGPAADSPSATEPANASVAANHGMDNGDTNGTVDNEVSEKETGLAQQSTHSDATSPVDLRHEKTISESIDLENKQAFKGDDSDGKVEWTVRKLFASAFLAMLYTGSQIPLYFVGGCLTFIAEEIGGTNASIIGWLPTANTLAIAAICPFVGYLDDLVGKRYITLLGAVFICLGCVLVGTAHSFAQAIIGMGFAGAGAGIGELTGLAGLNETVPVKYRGYITAVLTAFVFPFTPYVLYSELLSTHHTWRWGMWISLIYNGVTGLGLLFTYFPVAHVRAEGLSALEIIKRIDFIGGILSIVGLTIFLVALQAGGYSHSWTSAYVLCTLIIGIFTLIAWIIYEWKFAKHPMVPGGLFQKQRVVALAYVVAFVAGMNFFSYLNFWPLLISHVYNPDPVKVGLRGIGAGLGTTIGAILASVLVSMFPSRVNLILFAFATIITAFGGALSVVTPDNEVTTVVLGSFSTFGLGGIIVPAALTAMIAAPDALITTCAALSLSVRAVGGSIGYSIYFNIFSKKLKTRLPTYVAGAAIKAGLPVAEAENFVGALLQAPDLLAKLPNITPQIIAAGTYGAQLAYAESLRYVWWTSISFGVLAMVAALLIPSTKKFQTNRIAVAL
ncbi:uncharacterized protein PV09_09448 [Verruconis gallopava]|uniref:Major facilitator superfamily (MFS) profile domain-containing protein n=1 Tax=Verruconis gallopava TaxID=253628 RepID=A0A0D1YDH6_9PEZI|nr:uncharacterized protein PV09_09448 [Verruconis gallopava]KIV98796.1 hypothetical protein PV09_09448 [Verruconis gallopava]